MASATRGLYTSLDAGQSWSYDALIDPTGQPTDATSATSVAFNPTAGVFLAAVRYHGFYSSPDGNTWTRLSSQRPGAVCSAQWLCPPQSTSNNQSSIARFAALRLRSCPGGMKCMYGLFRRTPTPTR